MDKNFLDEKVMNLLIFDQFMNISPHLIIDALILSTALTTLVLRAKGNARKEKESKWFPEMTNKNSKGLEYKIWNFFFYLSFIAIGIFLVYLYSLYLYKQMTHIYENLSLFF